MTIRSVSQSPYAWAVENGLIRFGDYITGDLEVVARADMDPTITPDKNDTLFGGNLELIRVFTKVVIDFTTMKMCELEWSSITPKTDLDERVKNSWFQKLQYWTGKYDASMKAAKTVYDSKEMQVTRLKPIVRIGNRRNRDGYR